MNKIVGINEVGKLSNIFHNQGDKIVLVGGCFDILHSGHIYFLNQAKKNANILILLLENDDSIRRKKGPNRPVNTQNERAQVLEALIMVDIIILLPKEMSDSDYDDVVNLIKPAIIATTKGDPARAHKERQAAQIGSQVIEVAERKTAYASSKLAALLEKEL